MERGECYRHGVVGGGSEAGFGKANDCKDCADYSCVGSKKEVLILCVIA